ncbi:hypothetical protein K470DRAFT_22778 [Piedraia hortae CBS 480.64]|uniref:Uncharacterized protein n=1 Tax=Piedraia hortae CBS 480.64 TaxID=1314780 RepID=A0A6A7C4A0_9PEZI|nr:hypothetical protein K470DRAFT_22778 [Piedraia hortae CBS 480.64]
MTKLLQDDSTDYTSSTDTVASKNKQRLNPDSGSAERQAEREVFAQEDPVKYTNKALADDAHNEVGGEKGPTRARVGSSINHAPRRQLGAPSSKIDPPKWSRSSVATSFRVPTFAQCQTRASTSIPERYRPVARRQLRGRYSAGKPSTIRRATESQVIPSRHSRRRRLPPQRVARACRGLEDNMSDFHQNMKEVYAQMREVFSPRADRLADACRQDYETFSHARRWHEACDWVERWAPQDFYPVPAPENPTVS